MFWGYSFSVTKMVTTNRPAEAGNSVNKRGLAVSGSIPDFGIDVRVKVKPAGLYIYIKVILRAEKALPKVAMSFS